ncbi:von Willebrand factor A domain-containing protein 7 [Lingula anatina]|uniref:von Willebrand factor A domain-containing protein 7 n=1 Tax=Lingula anatina TaxID=7574 RepID=A0A1S3ILV9_LINAN|nr:von Willebrand factor A domain-containing protein 7 [Lingula anatina]|eukprot:XP_013398504.1 von Willebrand factor A domain-containing protein 7 [Lingula anatina]
METVAFIYNLFTVLYIVKMTVAFMPNFSVEKSNDLRDARTHANITKEAALQTLAEYLFDHRQATKADDSAQSVSSASELYKWHFGDQNVTTKMFTVAMLQIEDGSASMDLSNAFKDLSSAHFDSERISESQNRLVAERIKVALLLMNGDIEGARMAAGGFLHSLQDFYSHSNWVEIGHQSQNLNLGESERSLGNTAHPSAQTCANCDSESCNGNILSNIQDARLLTSGYVAGQKDSNGNLVTKRVGKCSHGGVMDSSATKSATGGINKDTPNAKLSPHHYLHQTAADLAKAATISYLRKLRQCPGDVAVREFLGASQGGSLCMVLDTTVSMADVIVEIENAVSRIAETRNNSDWMKYILVPFNDPGYGPVYTTYNSTAYAEKLRSIHAKGGGDTDEQSMNGLRLALHAIPHGTPIFVFTDALSKDSEVASDVHALIAHKNSPVYFILNDQFGGNPNPSKYQSGENGPLHSYDTIALHSGGQIMRPKTKTEFTDSINIIAHLISPDLVTLMIRYNHPGSGTFDFSVDKTIYAVFVLVVCSPQVKDNVQILDPTGINVAPSADHVVSTTSIKLFKLNSISRGWWKVFIDCDGSPECSCNVHVLARSTLDIVTSFAREMNVLHRGLKKVPARPTKDNMSYVRLHVVGADGFQSPLQSNQILASGYSSKGSATLFSHALNELVPKEEYYFSANFQNISQGFRIGMEAKDTDGQQIDRIVTQLIFPVESEILLDYSTPRTWQMPTGGTDRVTVKVSNLGTLGADMTLLRQIRVAL